MPLYLFQYLHFDNNIINKKEIITLFKSSNIDDLENSDTKFTSRQWVKDRLMAFRANDNTQVRGYVSKTNTPLQRKIDAEILRKKRAEADVRRANEEWNIENADDIGLRANALFKYLVEEGTIDGEEADVYDAVPQPYAHYGLQTFEVLGQDGGYAVGDEEEHRAPRLERNPDVIDNQQAQGEGPQPIDIVASLNSSRLLEGEL